MTSEKTTILFVDDDEAVLAGLRRALYRMKNRWKMMFANSGTMALQILENEPVEIIVCDLRMPEMDGIEVLKIVRDSYPNTTRIIFSGYARQETIYETVGIAHQYLSKPSDPQNIIQRIERIVATRSMIENDKLKSSIMNIKAIPSVPSLYREILATLQSENPSLKKIGAIISRDIGMSSKILQLVNSSFFGLPQKVTQPELAVTLLGVNTIVSLVIHTGLFNTLPEDSIAKQMFATIQGHSFRTSIFAKKIAEHEKLPANEIDTCFIIGLLHDCGKMILLKDFVESDVFGQRHDREKLIQWETLENKVYGVSHAHAGAYLLNIWGLPLDVIEAVANHHEPQVYELESVCPGTIAIAADRIDHYLDEEEQQPFNEYLEEKLGENMIG